MKLLKIIFFTFILISDLQIQLSAQTKNDLKAKKELAKSIIDDFLPDLIEQEYVYFLSENFPFTESIDDINKSRKTKIKLVDKVILGEKNYFFQPFLVKRNLATVFFGNSWTSLNGRLFFETIYEYKCKRKKGKWDCQARKITQTES